MTSTRRNDEIARTPASWRALQLAGIACAVTLLVSANVARAEDDEEEKPDQSIEQQIIGGLLHGLGGQSMEDNNKGIDYRERSPLVVPSKIDLPPPAPKKPPAVANWPKDPDVQARREAIEAAKQPGVNWDDAKRPLMPSELAAKPKKKSASTAVEDDRPGIDNSNYFLLSPSQLGFSGSMWSGMLGKESTETKKFVSEPSRSSLSQPPVGYQTPSASYAYGVGQLKTDQVQSYNPTLDKGDYNLAR